MPQRKRQSPSTKNPAHLSTTGSNLRMQTPASSRKPKPKPQVARRVAQEINPARGFMNFLREHTVVTLAVGFAIATQAQTIIKQLIASFINPLYGLLFSEKLSSKAFVLHFHGRSQSFAWGEFVYAFVDFLFVLGAIYLFVKVFGLDKLEKPKNK